MNPLKLLGSDEVKKIHEATLRILSDTGINVIHEETRDLMVQKGCAATGTRVRIPPKVVEEHVKMCPSGLTLFGRSGQGVYLGSGKAHAQTLNGAPQILDLETGKRREVKIKDCNDLSRLADGLDNIRVLSSSIPQDVNQELLSLIQTMSMLRNTTKPIRHGIEDGFQATYILKLLSAVAEGEQELVERPMSYIGICPVSPLAYSRDVIEGLSIVAKTGYPLEIMPCPMMGATGPITVAGCIAQQNAELLAGATIAQMINPGTPVLFSPRLTFMEMRSGNNLMAAPEVGITAAVQVQMAKEYKVPVTTMATTSSKVVDFQSGYERLYNGLITALAGSDLVTAAGALDNCLVISYEQMVSDDEIASMVYKTVEGFQVSEETLALNIIDTVMNKPGSSFLSQKHTREYFRKGELWSPSLQDRSTSEAWVQEGSKDYSERARERCRSILSSHEVEPLSDTVESEVEKIMEAAAREIG